jgi:hypothetical protein
MKRSVIALLASAVCLVGLFAAFGQMAEKPLEETKPTDGAIVVGQPMPAILGRFQMEVWEQQNTLIVIDSHTGQCWNRGLIGRGEWRDLGSPTKQK